MVDTVSNKLKEIITAERPPVVDDKPVDPRILWLCALVLIAVVFATYGRTLTTYFLADDFGEVAYMARIAAGEWHLFWQNWTGNFMQIPGMAVYRPFLLVSLLTDYLIWKGNAFGYYLTNMLYYTGDTILIFAIVRQFTKNWDVPRSLLAAFFSACLFAVSPLHCESVSWVVGRVDTACCFFSLSSIFCYLLGKERGHVGWTVGSIAFFTGGILFKEMAISVPILITAIEFLFPRNSKSATPVASFFKAIAPIWIATAVYFVVRYLALGTLVGGYTGAIGDGQGASAFQRWLDPHTYERVVLPFALSLFPTHGGLENATKLLYASCLTVVSLRILRKEIPLRYALLLGAWLFSAAVPIYRLWGLGMDMEGARFCFFLTVPLSMLLPILFFVPSNKKQTQTGGEPGSAGVPPASMATDLSGNAGGTPALPGSRLALPGSESALPGSKVSSIPGSKTPGNQDRTTIYFCVGLLVALTFISYKTALHSNANWVHAGKEVRSVLAASTALAEQNPGKQLVVLGIPKVKAGAHMIYNGATFKTMLAPPFTSSNVSSRFLTFDPIFYGPDQYLNAARFKATLARADVAGPFVWDTKTKSFLKPKLNVEAIGHRSGSAGVPPASVAIVLRNGITMTSASNGEGIVYEVGPLNPCKYDYLEVSFRVPKDATELKFAARWTASNGVTEGNLAERIVAPHGARDVTTRIPLSHYWHWFAGGDISKIILYPPAVKGLEIVSVQLLSDTTLRPTISLPTLTDDGSGVFAIDNNTRFVIDAHQIPGAAAIVIECSKPNYFFDQIDEKDQAKALQNKLGVRGTTFADSLPAKFIERNQYCELRAHAISSDEKPLGEYSEPVILYAK